jgi:hypothetical protein
MVSQRLGGKTRETDHGVSRLMQIASQSFLAKAEELVLASATTLLEGSLKESDTALACHLGIV